jgi:hypothetical protein
VSYVVEPGVTGITSVVLQANGTTVATLSGPNPPRTIILPSGAHALQLLATGPGGAVSLGQQIGVTVRSAADGVVFLDGIRHTALSAATFQLLGSSLRIGNIGSSGQDGVSLATGVAGRAVLTLAPLEAGGPLANGAFLQLSAQGSVSGVAGQPVGNLRVTRTATGAVLLPNFSALGASTHRVQVFNQGALVLELAGYGGSVSTSTLPTSLGVADGGFFARYLGGTTFTVGPAVATGDEVRLLPEGAPLAVGYVSRVDLRASGIPSITIDAETVTPLPPPSLDISCIGVIYHLRLEPTVTNAQYRLEASTDLANWSAFGTITAPGVTLEVEVPAAYSSGPRWFFRAQALAP